MRNEKTGLRLVYVFSFGFNYTMLFVQYIKDCLVSESKKSENVTSAAEMVDNPTLLLVVAWKNFIITTAKQSVCVSV